jgi:hypothetical protein
MAIICPRFVFKLRVDKAVHSLCLRFHSVVRRLRTRHDGRPTFDVEDEYDVQDLLHALLRLHFHDIRRRELVFWMNTADVKELAQWVGRTQRRQK